MIEACRGIPGHIALLLNEKLPLEEPKKTLKHIKSMRKDLEDQVLASINSADEPFYPAKKPTDFRIILGAGLDLLSGDGACAEPPCRIRYVDQVSRSIGIMGDEVFLHDFLGESLMDLRTLTDIETHKLLSDIYVLRRLKPLIKAGIIKFTSPFLATCSSCMGEFNNQVDDIAKKLFETFSGELSVERKSGRLAVDTGPMYQPSVVIRYEGSPPEESDEELILQAISRCVRSTLWEAREAAAYGGALFSNSRIGLSGMHLADGWPADREQLRLVEGQRAGNLPWLANLSIEQTLILREEAASALPQLREFLSRNLAATQKTDQTGTSPNGDFIMELREQAAQVRSELERIKSKRKNFGRAGIGTLSLGISALGLASGGIAAAAGATQLLGTLGLLHFANEKDHDKEQELKSKPGYVLVAAQEILSHAR